MSDVYDEDDATIDKVLSLVNDGLELGLAAMEAAKAGLEQAMPGLLDGAEHMTCDELDGLVGALRALGLHRDAAALQIDHTTSCGCAAQHPALSVSEEGGDVVQTFYVTFGVQYAPRNQEHPLGWPQGNGWMRVLAPHEAAARLATVDLLGMRWSQLYRAEDHRPEFFPLGELALLDATGDEQVLTVFETGGRL